jgi:hypothetical protein
MLPARIDRKQIVIAKRDELDSNDAEYWNHATIEEKLQTITFLRECYHGKGATSRGFQRFHTVFEFE